MPNSKPAVSSPAEDIHAPAVAPAAVLSPEERYRRIAEAAYFLAAARDFTPGDPTMDWLEAEKEVDASLNGG